MSKKIILDLCGGTGAWSKYYQQDPDYKVYVMTLPDFDITKPNTFPGKIAHAIQTGKIYGILAAPPCTMFSIARNDTTAKKKRDLREGMETIKACLNIIWWAQYENYRAGQGLQFWCLENPASGYLKKFLGKPAMEFDPSEYGDPYTKKTALWGMFKEPKKNPIKATRGSMVKYASGFKDIKPVDPIYQKKLGIDARTIRRSITPDGFAKEFYKANR